VRAFRILARAVDEAPNRLSIAGALNGPDRQRPSLIATLRGSPRRNQPALVSGSFGAGLLNTKKARFFWAFCVR
jgi:hypothetical protein